jgi:hypothetical protein
MFRIHKDKKQRESAFLSNAPRYPKERGCLKFPRMQTTVEKPRIYYTDK